MQIDELLTRLPIAGFFLKKSYAFWRKNLAIANTTHIILGGGITLLIFTRFDFYGTVLVFLAAVIHIVAFVKGEV